MTENRMRELLKAAIQQIEAFEEDMAGEVFESLGFTREELQEIKTM